MTVFHSGVCALSTARQVAPAKNSAFGTGQLNQGRSASRKQMMSLLPPPPLTSSTIQCGISCGLGKKVNVFCPAQMYRKCTVEKPSGTGGLHGSVLTGESEPQPA